MISFTHNNWRPGFMLLKNIALVQVFYYITLVFRVMFTLWGYVWHNLFLI